MQWIEVLSIIQLLLSPLQLKYLHVFFKFTDKYGIKRDRIKFSEVYFLKYDLSKKSPLDMLGKMELWKNLPFIPFLSACLFFAIEFNLYAIKNKIFH